MKDRKRIALVYFVCICIIAIMASCESNLDIALKDAGKNRQELEKVLNHFKDDPNHLKYKAAKFLIENMPYHYSMYGDCMKQYSLAYEKMAHEPFGFCDSF
ncbi:hypothetical protein [Prevotella sp.]|uniref:hypothetical protein n=1 Tax=Prevotella sp. TaxID=59823 RepID=UPI003DA6A6DE